MWDFLASLEWKTIFTTSGAWIAIIISYFVKRRIERRGEHDSLDIAGKKLANISAAANLVKEHGESGMTEGLKLLSRLEHRPRTDSIAPEEARIMEVGVNQIVLNYEHQLFRLSDRLIGLCPSDARWKYTQMRAATQMLRRFDRLHAMNMSLDEALTNEIRGFDVDRLRLAMGAMRHTMVDAFNDEPDFQRILDEEFESDLAFLSNFKFPPKLN